MYTKFFGYLNLYADDSSITVAANNPNELFNKLTSDIEAFHEWTICNKLTINAKKTKILPYCTKRRKSDLLSQQGFFLNGIPLMNILIWVLN